MNRGIGTETVVRPIGGLEDEAGADEEEERVINLVDPRGEQIVRSPELQRGRSVVERKKRRPQQQQSTSPSLGSSLSPQGGSSYS